MDQNTQIQCSGHEEILSGRLEPRQAAVLSCGCVSPLCDKACPRCIGDGPRDDLASGLLTALRFVLVVSAQLASQLRVVGRVLIHRLRKWEFSLCRYYHFDQSDGSVSCSSPARFFADASCLSRSAFRFARSAACLFAVASWLVSSLFCFCRSATCDADFFA